MTGSLLQLCGHKLQLVLQLLDCHYQHFNLWSEDDKLVLLDQRWWSWWLYLLTMSIVMARGVSHMIGRGILSTHRRHGSKFWWVDIHHVVITGLLYTHPPLWRANLLLSICPSSNSSNGVRMHWSSLARIEGLFGLLHSKTYKKAFRLGLPSGTLWWSSQCMDNREGTTTRAGSLW